MKPAGPTYSPPWRSGDVAAKICGHAPLDAGWAKSGLVSRANVAATPLRECAKRFVADHPGCAATVKKP